MKAVATRCPILVPTAPNSISDGALSQTPLESLQRSAGPLAAFNGPATSKGREEGNGEWKGVGKETGKERVKKEGNRGDTPGFYLE